MKWESLKSSHIPKFDDQFACQNCYGPPPEFPLAPSYSGRSSQVMYHFIPCNFWCYYRNKMHMYKMCVSLDQLFKKWWPTNAVDYSTNKHNALLSVFLLQNILNVFICLSPSKMYVHIVFIFGYRKGSDKQHIPIFSKNLSFLWLIIDFCDLFCQINTLRMMHIKIYF